MPGKGDHSGSENLLPREAEAFLQGMKVPATLATIGRSGGPVTSAVWYAIDGGELIVSTPSGGTKARNVDANPRVSFLVDTRERPYSGVAIEGDARVVDDPDGAGWRFIATSYLGEPLPREILERFRASPRVLIRITPARVRTWNLPTDDSG